MAGVLALSALLYAAPLPLLAPLQSCGQKTSVSSGGSHTPLPQTEPGQSCGQSWVVSKGGSQTPLPQASASARVKPPGVAPPPTNRILYDDRNPIAAVRPHLAEHPYRDRPRALLLRARSARSAWVSSTWATIIPRLPKASS